MFGCLGHRQGIAPGLQGKRNRGYRIGKVFGDICAVERDGIFGSCTIRFHQRYIGRRINNLRDVMVIIRRKILPKHRVPQPEVAVVAGQRTFRNAGHADVIQIKIRFHHIVGEGSAGISAGSVGCGQLIRSVVYGETQVSACAARLHTDTNAVPPVGIGKLRQLLCVQLDFSQQSVGRIRHALLSGSFADLQGALRLVDYKPIAQRLIGVAGFEVVGIVLRISDEAHAVALVLFHGCGGLVEIIKLPDVIAPIGILRRIGVAAALSGTGQHPLALIDSCFAWVFGHRKGGVEEIDHRAAVKSACVGASPADRLDKGRAISIVVLIGEIGSVFKFPIDQDFVLIRRCERVGGVLPDGLTWVGDRSRLLAPVNIELIVVILAGGVLRPQSYVIKALPLRAADLCSIDIKRHRSWGGIVKGQLMPAVDAPHRRNGFCSIDIDHIVIPVGRGINAQSYHIFSVIRTDQGRPRIREAVSDVIGRSRRKLPVKDFDGYNLVQHLIEFPEQDRFLRPCVVHHQRGLAIERSL